MSRQFNEVYFSELEKQERTGVQSKWLQEQADDRDPGYDQIEQCSPWFCAPNENPF